MEDKKQKSAGKAGTFFFLKENHLIQQIGRHEAGKEGRNEVTVKERPKKVWCAPPAPRDDGTEQQKN